MGNFKDEVLKLLGKDQPTNPEPAPAEPTNQPETTPEPTPEPTGEDLTPEAINQIIEERLEKERTEMTKEMAEVLKSFKGEETPATGSPAEPTNTASDFSAWNAEIEAIEKRNSKN